LGLGINIFGFGFGYNTPTQYPNPIFSGYKCLARSLDLTFPQNSLKKDLFLHGVIFFNFQARMLGGGTKNCPKKYNIDYFGYAVNFEFKFKLNFDEERGSKIEKNVKI
jgi:hypothetical protein